MDIRAEIREFPENSGNGEDKFHWLEARLEIDRLYGSVNEAARGAQVKYRKIKLGFGSDLIIHRGGFDSASGPVFLLSLCGPIW